MSSPLHYPMMHPTSMPVMANHPARLRASSHFSQTARPSTTSHPAARYRADSDSSIASRCSSSPEAMAGERQPETLCNGAIRCWSHGCNGREFSSLGNYRRHFREQHRVCKKFCCQRCGRTFSRSTARNVHFEKRKCRAVRLDHDSSKTSSASSSPSLSHQAPPPPQLIQEALIQPFASPATTHYELSPPLSRSDSLDSIFPYQPSTPPTDLLHMSPMPSLYDFDCSKSASPMSDFEASQWPLWDDSLQLGEPAMWEDFNQPMLNMDNNAFLDPASNGVSVCMPQQLDLQWMSR